MTNPPRYVCVHGHFYQPPRENPWLEELEREPSAAPYHDWNERIWKEAYAPNAFSRILDGEGRIVRIVNNYARMSFNFGPTLLSWMARRAPETYQAVLEADRESAARFSGHGSALAQAYGHMILPLASSRDKRTQIAWGVRDFEYRFGRPPEGMWLPETAVDLESLDLMAAEGIRFTVLAPRQAASVREASGGWTDASGERVDPGRSYRVALPSGREIAVFFYDGGLSREVAFEGLLSNGGVLARRLLSAGGDGRSPGSLTHIATDGETYGHHHRHGEMALSYALDVIEADPKARLTNYGEYLSLHPPEREARIVENSSWSCVHGVERWRSDCGCSTGDHTEWRQSWREPLREALDWLRDELATRYESEAGALLPDPWEARDRYVEAVLDRSEEVADAVLEELAGRRLGPQERTRALQLLELQRHAMLMYTSCGWFFDDLARIETLQVVRYADRALHLGEALFGDGLEEGFLSRLAEARSNVPGLGTGEDLYRARIEGQRVDLGKVAAHYAVASLFEEENGHVRAGERAVYCYVVNVEDGRRLTSASLRLALGKLRVTSRITRETAEFSYGVLHLGDHHLVGGVRPFGGEEPYQALSRALVDEFERGDSLAMIRIVDREFQASTYSLQSLFRDEQERVMERIMGSSLGEAEAVLGSLFESRMPLMRFLADMQIPQPRPFRAVGEFVLQTRLERALEEPVPDLDRARELFHHAELTGLRVDRESLGHVVAGAAARLLEGVVADPDDENRLDHAWRLIEFARLLPFPVELWDAQNAFFRLMEEVYPERARRAGHDDPEIHAWIQRFRAVGTALAIAVPEEPPP